MSKDTVHQKTKPLLAKSIETSDEGIRILLPDRSVLVPWDACPASLRSASTAQRQDAKLSASGYGVHWPQVDEDLTIAGLVKLGN